MFYAYIQMFQDSQRVPCILQTASRMLTLLTRSAVQRKNISNYSKRTIIIFKKHDK